MNELKKGYFPALGTPLDENGNVVVDSLKKHIEQQIDAGASGLLLMGSMGIEACIKNSAYETLVKVADETNAGRLPLFVGAMDVSIAKVMEKIDLMGNANVAGVVLTTPFYSTANDEQAINWFTKIADKSRFPIFLYDLPGVTKYKININVISALINHKNIKGMKTADLDLILKIGRMYPDADFQCLYSGLDTFDYANMIGVERNLDGMFSCMPKTSKKMYECMANKDFAGARKHLDNILLLRDTMFKYRLMPCFTYCMNLIGLDGIFHPDYNVDITDEGRKVMKELMIKIGEVDE